MGRRHVISLKMENETSDGAAGTSNDPSGDTHHTGKHIDIEVLVMSLRADQNGKHQFYVRHCHFCASQEFECSVSQHKFLFGRC